MYKSSGTGDQTYNISKTLCTADSSLSTTAVKHVSSISSLAQIWALDVRTTAEVVIMSTSVVPRAQLFSRLITVHYDYPGFCLLIKEFELHQFVSFFH